MKVVKVLLYFESKGPKANSSLLKKVHEKSV